MDRQRGHGLQWTGPCGGLWKGQAVLEGTGMINKDWCELAVLVRIGDERQAGLGADGRGRARRCVVWRFWIGTQG